MKKIKEEQIARQRERQRESVKRYQDSRRSKEPSRYAKKMAVGMEQCRKNHGYRCILTGSRNIVVAHLLGRRTRYKRYDPTDPRNMFCITPALHTGKDSYDEHTSVPKRIEWLRGYGLHNLAERLIWLTTPDDRALAISHNETEANI
ncbi:hypothetical protein [Leptospira sp. GIMC2001]|uniref:hypothetical protein n=1 Tax=Leptospira sp. GIMC2001 TaxID=1513297 RepID=UPI0023490ACA|nr:hypothetical protein [Leptospira sp. GIMC2001]WCL51447.1 hypothetical protein O4O04_20235 [Leptospira sp. GIMC2001]